MLVLAVELHQELAQALEQAHGGGRVVHEGAVPAGARQLALDDELARRPGGARPRRAARPPGRPGSISNTAETIAVSAPGADPVELGAGAGEEQERVHHDGLAGAGLAGEHVEAGGERHHRLFHHREIANRQLAQHR